MLRVRAWHRRRGAQAHARYSFGKGQRTIQDLFNGFQEAFTLIIGGDNQLAEIVLLSLRVSGIALAISTVIGIPVGALLGLARFRGRRLSVALVYTGMAFPPVVIGLFVYLLLSRSGVLGGLGLPWLPKLFTPEAMILAQVIIAFPLVAGFTSFQKRRTPMDKANTTNRNTGANRPTSRLCGNRR